MPISSLELVKIASISRSGFIRVWGTMPKITEEKIWITLRTPPDTTGDRIAVLDMATKQITDIISNGDFGFKVPLYFHRVKSDGTRVIERIAGFGEYLWSGLPSMASVIFRFKDDDTVDYTYNTHTDVGNPNNDNNLDKCVYIPSDRKLICSTAQGGRHIWIIDIEQLQWLSVGRILSTINAQYAYHVGIVPGDNRIFFIGGDHNTGFISDSNPFIVCSVELDDLLQNLANDIGLDQLSSYQEIHKDGQRGIYDAPAVLTSVKKKVIVRTIDVNGTVRYTVIDFANNTVNDLNITPPSGAITGSYVFRILQYWALIDNNGVIHVLDNNMNEVTTITIPNFNNYKDDKGQPTIGAWLNGLLIGYDNVNGIVDVYAFKVNDVIPKITLDQVNKIVTVRDILTGDPIANASIQISVSRAGNPLDEPIDVTPTTRTTDSNGQVSFGDLVQPNKFISIQLIDIPG